MDNIQSQLSRDTVYSRLTDRPYTFELDSELVFEHSYQKTYANTVQIALDFYSDKSDWTYVGSSRVGDFKPINLGNEEDKTSYSKIKRFESATALTSHKIRCSSDESYPNGFFANVIYIGNHNLQSTDYIIFKAYNDSSFTSLAYSQKIAYNKNDIFYVNNRQYSKYKYYELEFVLSSSRVLKLGRVILAGALNTVPENNPQQGVTAGYVHYKDEMMTESKTKLFNTKFFGKKISFSIQIDTNTQQKLSSQIEQLILEGTGSRPFLVIFNPKDPNDLSLYGILTSESSFEHKQLGYGLYYFDTEEIQ